VTVDLALAGQQNTGGGGIDTLSSIEDLTGANFNDVLKGNDFANTLRGLAGNDDLDGRGGNDNLVGQDGADTLSGGEGRDVLQGGSENDVLLGGGGDDRLFGDAGDDQLTGGGGLDQLRGGLGVDRFIFLAATDSPAAARDQILDFEGASAAGGDVIDLSGIDAMAGGADDPFTFAGSAFTGAAGQLIIQDKGSYSVVFADLNGDKVADFSVYVLGATPVGVGDLVL
jgi:serralysin